MMTRSEFIAAYVFYCFDGGFSFDEWDINARWKHYQQGTQDYSYLEKFKQ
jgi:hypothetical protein